MTLRSRADATYELLRPLAEGGMAELFLARAQDTGDPSVVVLKRIRSALTRDPTFVNMFLDEARLASRLNHPGIARVIDVGRTGDTYYYTMEYVRGVDARELLMHAARRHLTIPTSVAVAIVIGAARALHAAHEQRDARGKPLQIVHRDVSPSNLMVSFQGHVKVVDFGVAKAVDRMTETRSGAIKGKIAYLSPEQCRGLPLDRRSDVFSLGIVAWELLTQRRLFRRPSDYATMHAITTEVVAPASSRNPDVPAAVDAVVARALARDLSARTRTAQEFADQLDEIARELGWDIGPGPTAAVIREVFGEPDDLDAVTEGDVAATPDVTSEIDLNQALIADDSAAAFGAVTVRRRAPPMRAPTATPPPLPIPGPRSASGELIARATAPAPVLLHGELAVSVVVSDGLLAAPDSGPAAPAPGVPPERPATRSAAPPRRRGSLGWLAAVSVVGLGVGALVAVLVVGRDQAGEPPTSARLPVVAPAPAPIALTAATDRDAVAVPPPTPIALDPVVVAPPAVGRRSPRVAESSGGPADAIDLEAVVAPPSLERRFDEVRVAYRAFRAKFGDVHESQWQDVLFATTRANQTGAVEDRDRALAKIDALLGVLRARAPAPGP